MTMLKNYDKIVPIIVALASVLLGLYNTWAIQNPPDSSDLVSKGNQYFTMGDYRKAINFYEKALRLHSSYGNALKYKGLALFNLGLNNENMSVKIISASPYDSPCIYAEDLIDYYNSSFYQPDTTSRTYFEGSYQYLKDASYNNPTDLEALLFGGIASLYLSPSPSYDPIKDFDRTLRAVEDTSYMQKSLQVRTVKSAAWYGKGVACLKMDDKEEADKCFKIALANSQKQTAE
ncbi:MAG: tetratricopeptide repeat protein [Methanotrichaceae archaeon]|nr:tetratricopeptide repeat protein [Methanotrichaceae archaeon]